MPSRVLVCGTGNTAHVLAALLAARGDCAVRVFTRCVEKAARWQQALAEGSLVVTETAAGCTREIADTTAIAISTDPSAARDCDIVFMALTAFSTGPYLELLAPYIETHAVIAGLPGQGGFEYEVARHLGEKPVLVLNFESAPWVCRIVEFGRHVHISGVKGYLCGALEGDRTRARLADPFHCLRRVIGPQTKLVESRSLVAMTLMSVNGYSHPPIMYGAWRNWDGRPVETPPSFYRGIEPDTADLMTQMSGEVVAVSGAIAARHPEHDLSAVMPMLAWDRLAYGAEISDGSSQLSALRTNRAYESIVHPMRQHETGGWLPDFTSRFLTEDVPFGLVPIRGIAELAGVETPRIDEVLRWSEQKLGKRYLNGSRLSGVDIASTSCPQRYGYRVLEEIL